MGEHPIVLPTLLKGLRGKTDGALGRVWAWRTGAGDTLKRGVWVFVYLGGKTNGVQGRHEECQKNVIFYGRAGKMGPLK